MSASPAPPAPGIPAAVYPAYAYPRAPAPASRLGGITSRQIAVAAGLLVILLIATVVVSALALRAVTASHQACTANCSPKLIQPLSSSATYTSSAFKFEVDYSVDWTERSRDANGITLGTELGSVSVRGMKSGQTLEQVIDGTVSALPSSSWQNITRVSDLKGAHMGDQSGVGAVYSANLVGSNSTATRVRFAVIAATRGGVTVVMFAMDPADTAHFANGMEEGQLFDYMCAQFRWGG